MKRLIDGGEDVWRAKVCWRPKRKNVNDLERVLKLVL